DALRFASRLTNRPSMLASPQQTSDNGCESGEWRSFSHGSWCAMRNLLRVAAQALANLAEKAHQWADWAHDWTAEEFGGGACVGIASPTRTQRIARHVIWGWARSRARVAALPPAHGVGVFGVNSTPFPIPRRPVAPGLLPSFKIEQFHRRGHGPGLIEYGSAFYDYFFVALTYAQELAAVDEGRQTPLAVTISLLCDGFPNGGTYRAHDVL